MATTELYRELGVEEGGICPHLPAESVRPNAPAAQG